MLHNEEYPDLSRSRDSGRTVEHKRIRWAAHVNKMGKTGTLYRILVGKPIEKVHFEK